MSSYSVTQCETDLQGMLHGTTNNQITGLTQLINRAGRQLLLDCDPQETIRMVPIASAIYGGVYDYPLPTDVKGNKVIDIRPQYQRSPMDMAIQEYSQDFDLYKSITQIQNFNINFNTSVKTLRLNIPQMNQGTTVNAADGINDNGTWSTFGTASNLQADSVNFISPSSSLSFDLATGGNPSVGGVENSTMEAQDLTNYLNQGANFWWAFLPTASNFINMKLRLGSSATDYYEWTVTADFSNNTWVNGWNQQGPAWLGATVVGSPDITNIVYCRVTYTYDGTAQTSVRLNQIVSNLGSIFNIEYYSKYIFRSSTTGAYQETVLSDNDLINLDTETYNLFLDLVFMFAVQQQLSEEGAYDMNEIKQKYQSDLARYKSMYKSQISKPSSQYYRPRQASQQQWLGWNNWT